jgi:hypothetical protein
MTTLTIVLYVLGILYLLDQVVDIIKERIDEIKERQAKNNIARQLIANHPEMKGISLDNGDLLFFASDKEFRSLVMNNDEPGDNTAIEDNDRFAVVVVDDYDDDEE